MNNDLISREYVESIVKAEFVDLQDGTEEWRTYVNDTCENILNKVDNAPPVTPKSGHWVEEKINAGSRKVFCSECGCPPPFEHVNTGDVYSASGYGVINKTKFCPNCGAYMRKGGAE